MLTVRVIVSCVVLIILTLAGCAGPATTPAQTSTSAPASSTQTTTQTTTPTKTETGPYGELRIAVSTWGEERFNPTTISYTCLGNLLYPMFDFIVRLNGAELAPEIAEKWAMSADGLSWTYTIRKGIKFHNGEDLNADDVKFTLDRQLRSDAYNRELRDMVSNIDKVDDYTVRLNTVGTQPYVQFIASLQTSAPQGIVMPKDYFEQNGLEYFERHPVGSGPFKFVRHVPGDMAVYEALDKHWRQTADFEKLSIIIMPEETTRVASLKTGAVDIIDMGLESANQLEKAGYSTFQLQTMSPLVEFHGAYRSEAARMPAGDVRVRQALSLAINRDEIRDSFFYGKAGPPAPPHLWWGAPDIDGKYWMDYAAKIYRYDQEEAKRLLKEAGYGQGFNIKLYSFPVGGAPYLPKLDEVVAAYWEKIGVKAEIVQIDYGAFPAIRNTKKSSTIIGQAANFRRPESLVTPSLLQYAFHSKGTFALLDGAPFESEVDRLLDGAFSEMNSEKRKEMLSKVVKLVTDSYVTLVIGSVPSLVGLGPRVTIESPYPRWYPGILSDIAKHKN